MTDKSRIRLSVIGGSSVSTPELVVAWLAAAGEAASEGRLLPALDLVLQGQTPTKLEAVAAACRGLVDRARSEAAAPGAPTLPADVAVRTTTSLDQALEGADFVLNQVRVGGFAARAQDERFPRELGLIGEETLGAGGFANALRTIPVVLDQARAMERLCPGALLVILANPASLVQHAVARYTRVPTVGVCDMPALLQESAAKALNLPCSELDVSYVGMHHLGWITSVKQSRLRGAGGAGDCRKAS